MTKNSKWANPQVNNKTKIFQTMKETSCMVGKKRTVASSSKQLTTTTMTQTMINTNKIKVIVMEDRTLKAAVTVKIKI